MTIRRAIWAALSAAVLAGCGGHRPAAAPAAAPAATPPASTATAASTTTTVTITAPTTTLATTTTTTGVPAFSSNVSSVSATGLGSSYRPGCPLDPGNLRLLRLDYWGFDQSPHVGSIVVNEMVTQDVIKVFAALYAERFPIRQMVPIDAFQGSDPASMAADNTSGFNCRYAVAPGPPQWSVHAFGEAIDVNTVENPYVEGGLVRPPAGAAYLDRSLIRPGMAVAGGPLVDAFASAGWYWGGRWATPDYQHFSKTGG